MIKETKIERFKRVAARRTNEIIEKIRILGNCSNKSAYEYTDEDVERVFREIERNLRENKARFLHKKKVRFQL